MENDGFPVRDVLFFQRGQAFPNGIFCEFRYAVNVQLVHDLLAVSFDCLYAYIQFIGDFFC